MFHIVTLLLLLLNICSSLLALQGYSVVILNFLFDIFYFLNLCYNQFVPHKFTS